MARRFPSEESVKLWRVPGLGRVELMHAAYVTQTFPRHSHDGFAVGVIERGTLGFSYRGENVVAPAGTINLANPDEPHTGHAATDAGWTYRMFYLDADWLQEAAREMADRPQSIPFFQAGVIRDDDLAASIRALHVSLEQAEISSLERESRFLGMLCHLIGRHADAPPPLRGLGRERHTLRQVLRHIDEHLSENVSLAQLASVAGLSPFHFLRVFRSEVGISPHGYVTQMRIRSARALLRKGWPIAAAAQEAGFADQSHFTRSFKRLTGVTPGQYRKIVQDL